MKLWGRNTSVNVQKVTWALGELGLIYERVDIGGPFGGNDSPGYRALNPSGLIPTLEDEDLVLWESGAILRYLGRNYGVPCLEPADRAGRALADQWLEWNTSTFLPAISPAIVGVLRTPPDRQDRRAIDESRRRSVACALFLDGQLEGRPYIAGRNFSFADIANGIVAHRFFHVVDERPRLPNLERWYASLRCRRHFREQVEAPPLSWL